MEILITVAVGTDHHPFNRLMGWIDEWIEAHKDTHEISWIVQRGSSEKPRNCESHELLAHDELCESFARSTVVISHGGPSTIMDARAAGKLPIVVPRDPALGEHVDKHQYRFANHLREHMMANVATEKEDFFSLLADAIAHPERYVVASSTETIPGVAQFAAVVDELIGAQTQLIPADSACIDQQSDATGEHEIL